MLDGRYRRAESFVHRKIADETILVPIKSSAADLDSIYCLNGVGPRVWELLDGARTVAQVIECILDEYDVAPEVVESDVVRFLSELGSFGAVVRAD